MTIVRAGLVQAAWTGSQDSMLEKQIQMLRQAAEQEVQVVCLQELCSSFYLCQETDSAYYEWAELIPDGKTISKMQQLAQELELVLVVPIYEQEAIGVYYNSAAVIDADGTYLGKYRKTHLPNLPGFWEKFYFRPGNLGYPVFDTKVGRIGVYICYDRHFPEGARCLGLNGAEIVFIPSATARGLSDHLWFIEQTSHAIANGYWVGTINRVGREGKHEFYGSSYFASPEGKIIQQASDCHDELLVADLDLDLIKQTRHTWQFIRDRRPDAYAQICQP